MTAHPIRLNQFLDEAGADIIPITIDSMTRTHRFEHASRAALDVFLKKTGAQLWIQHDLAANAKMKKAPSYYE